MLSIAATISSPKIEYDKQNSILSMEGESYPENSFEFFEPVFTWLKNELPSINKLTLHVHIPYMNSSSTKCILDILDILAEKSLQGSAIFIEWEYEEGNDRALELAEEFKEDLSLPFKIIPIYEDS